MGDPVTATKNILTPVGRLSYPALFTPKPNDKGELKYSCTLIFDKAATETPEFKALKAAASVAAKEYFGDRLNNEAFRNALKSPFHSCDTHPTTFDKDGKKKPEYPAGGVFIRLSANNKPGCVNQAVQPILDQSEVYAGMYVRAQVNAFGYGLKADHKGNKGISLGLNHVQKIRDGESIGGRSRPEDAFESVAQDDAAAGATAGAGNTAASSLFD